MKSALPKTLHRIAGRSMLRHLLASCETGVRPHRRRGRSRHGRGAAGGRAARLRGAAGAPGHRARGAGRRPAQFGDGEVAVLYADNPLIRPERCAGCWRAAPPAMALVAAGVPPGRSRPLRPRDRARRLCRAHRRMGRRHARKSAPMTLCNAGVLCAAAADMRAGCAAVRADNAKGEYYLTDRGGAGRAPRASASRRWRRRPSELAGINSRARTRRGRRRWCSPGCATRRWTPGVTMIDPASVFLCADTQLSADVTIGPNVVFGPGVKVASGVEIRAFSHLEGCDIGPGCIVGPFARLRPGTVLGERRACRQFRRGQGGAARRRREGQPSDLSRRRRGRRGDEYRRRHHHLQLRRLRQAPHDDRRARLHRLGRRAGGAGHASATARSSAPAA